MEHSANIHHQQHHHHQLQDHQHVVANPSCYAAGSTHPWTPNTILNTSGFNACSDEGIFNNPRDSWQQNNMQLAANSVNSSMTQDSSFYWANNTSQNFHLTRIKNESSDTSCSKLTQVLLSSPPKEIEELYTSYMKNEQKDLLNLNTKHCSEDSNSALNSSVRSFSQILPTINVSNLNQMSNFSSVEANMQALDLFNSARFNEGFGQISRDQLGFFKGGVSYGLDHLQQTSVRPLSSPNNISSLSNVLAEAKRSSIMLESKAVPQTAPKKSRTEARASCPPFKVRKEKLGDRIAALQQLVAPFGKTDTASVLMEAIGYIKFLQNQVETLSVPYMNSSRNKTRVMQGVAAGYESEDPKRDNLRSRGLCLVPLSCLSYVTDDGGGIWPPPTFGGGL